ncbi:SAM-dependent methyltransferase, partial [Streptomyces sp. NPDC094034]
RLRHLENAYGHELSLDVYWVSPDRITELLSQTGLTVDARLIREPNEQDKPRHGQQAYFLARKPVEQPGPRAAGTIA